MLGEDAEHLVVEVHRAGQRVDLGPALQHQAADAALAEHDRGAGAGGAGADHDDRDVLWIHAVSPDGVVLGAEVERAVGGADGCGDPVAGLEVGAAPGLAADEQLPLLGLGQQADDALRERPWAAAGRPRRGCR